MSGPTVTIQVGWAYREPASEGDNEWHLTKDEPAARPGREIRRVWLDAFAHPLRKAPNNASSPSPAASPPPTTGDPDTGGRQ